MTATPGNSLLEPWRTPFEAPPFGAIATEHFRPAIDAGLAEHRAEIAAIAADPEPPSFANTIRALEASGRTLDKVSSVFFNLAGAHTSEALQAIERDVAPLFARHRNAIYLDDALFHRVDALHAQRDALGLDAEEARVLERYHLAFTRSGAGRPESVKQRLAAIGERLATLGTQFGQNVLADESSWALPLDAAAGDLDGLPDFVVAAAAKAAEDRGLAARHAVTLSRSLIEPFLQFSSRRDLREAAYRAWLSRGESEARDNRAIIAETVALRAERARLLGYPSFAHFRLDDAMARTPERALDLLHRVWRPARAKAVAERTALQALVAADGGNFDLAAWDWRYYAERRRRAEFDLDEAAVKPYLALERMIEAVFDTASRLFGLSFVERRDIEAYHPDVRVFEVSDGAGGTVGLFLGDYFARSSKRSGAWMSGYRAQQRLVGDIKPIIVNVMNFSKAPEGQETLLSFDDARTLFHEFGHALHGLLSDVTYPLISGTSVARDFVEFPSQLYEHWLERPEILQRFARHHETGEPMPAALIGKLLKSRTFNQGFATVEYVSSALYDLEAHLLPEPEGFDAEAFERRLLSSIDMPQAIAMRHRPPHFQHVFSGDGYSSAYYSYLWSEVLDADGFRAFEEAGDIFDRATAERLRRFVYGAGNRRPPEEAYKAFRGRNPDPAALIEKRGLAEPAPAGDA